MITPLILPKDLEISDEFQKCFDIIEHTQASGYLSGVAGSGKSTFLTLFRKNSRKNLVVVTPTGIAAVTIQGQTIHSFFKFPHSLIQKENVKRLWADGLFEKLDLLIIDEVSMVRPDLLDGIDFSLRINRERFDAPFGGVQIILIGDLFQLPPVLDKELAEHYSELYDTEYFFSANVLKEMPLYSFTFTKNYRQSDPVFMSLLNKIRGNQITSAELDLLNSRVNPDLAERAKDHLRLTPTNAAANAINHMRLAKIARREFLYQATILGEYDHRSHPADELLRLKVGAQVLMVKNDPDKRWVNGDIGEVEELNSDGMKIRMGHGVYDVHPVKWEKIGYVHDADGRIKPEVIATFEQYPVKLAWAVTIHKSQGLSLDKVIVDLDDGAFAHGQTYVALSRCRSFEGLILKRPVKLSDIIFDERIHRIFDLCRPIEGKRMGNGPIIGRGLFSPDRKDLLSEDTNL